MSAFDIVAVLKQQAEEITSKGIKGWGNTMLYAAEELAKLRAELKKTLEYGDEWQRACQERMREIEQLRAALEEAREAKKWVSVDNQMPENCVSVLVCFENSCRDDLMAIAWLDRGLWWLNPNHTLDRNYEHVTYWMPLPNPPDEIITHPTQTAQKGMTESEYKDYLSEQDRLKREAEEENQ